MFLVSGSVWLKGLDGGIPAETEGFRDLSTKQYSITHQLTAIKSYVFFPATKIVRKGLVCLEPEGFIIALTLLGNKKNDYFWVG